MQWTEPAGKLLVVREPARCRVAAANLTLDKHDIATILRRK
jgi:hypothetical protein